MQMVILTGGLGIRIRSLIGKIPKSIIPISNKPFLEYQLALLTKNHLTNIVLCVGYQAKAIKDHFKDGSKFGMKIKYSEEKERLLGTAGAIKNAQDLLEKEFFIMYGDSYLPIDLTQVFSYFIKFNKLALIVIYKNFNKYDISNVVVEGNLIKKYNRNRKGASMVYIDAGISILKKEVLDIIPSNKVVSLDEVFTQLIEEKEILAFETEQRFYEVGSRRGIKEFRRYMERSGK